MAVRGDDVASSIDSHVREAIQKLVGEIRSSVEDVREAVIRQYESRLDYRRTVEGLVDGQDDGGRTDDVLRDLLARASEAERDAELQARRRGEVSPAAADDVLFDIEARALRYDS